MTTAKIVAAMCRFYAYPQIIENKECKGEVAALQKIPALGKRCLICSLFSFKYAAKVEGTVK